MSNKDHFLFYFEWFDYLDDLPPALAFSVIRELARAAYGDAPESVGNVDADRLITQMPHVPNPEQKDKKGPVNKRKRK